MNDELKAYSELLLENTHLKRDEYAEPVMAFTAAVLEQIEDLLDCKAPTIKHSRITKSNGTIEGEIHGFAESNNGEVLYLFYSDFNANPEITSKNNTECQPLVARPQGFYNKAIRSYHTEYDVTSNEYEALKFIYDNNARFHSVQLVILSNFIINDLKIKKLRISTKSVFHDVWDMKKLFINSHSLSDHVPINIDFEDEDYQNFKIPYIQMESSKFGYKCIQAMVPAKFLYRLYEKYNTNLLYSNVRLFLGLKGNKEAKPNVAMLNTLRKEDEMFLAYNNGITVLAQGIEAEAIGTPTDVTDNSDSSTSKEYISMGILKKIHDFRIINGGQTTAVIFNAKKLSDKERDPEKKINLRGVYVQMKLIISDKISDISHQITTSSNHQNKVKISDFTVSNPFNKKMEELARTISTKAIPSHDAHHWFYERLRGQYDEFYKKKQTKQERDLFTYQFPSKKKFTKEEIAKVWNSWNNNPNDAVKGATTSYNLFIKSHTEEPSEEFYKKTIALLIIHRYILNRPESKQYGNGKATIAAYAIAVLNNESLGRLDLLKIWDNQSISDNLRIYINQMCDEIYIKLYNAADTLGMSLLSYGKTKDAFPALTRKTISTDFHLLDKDLTNV